MILVFLLLMPRLPFTATKYDQLNTIWITSQQNTIEYIIWVVSQTHTILPCLVLESCTNSCFAQTCKQREESRYNNLAIMQSPEQWNWEDDESPVRINNWRQTRWHDYMVIDLAQVQATTPNWVRLGGLVLFTVRGAISPAIIYTHTNTNLHTFEWTENQLAVKSDVKEDINRGNLN